MRSDPLIQKSGSRSQSRPGAWAALGVALLVFPTPVRAAESPLRLSVADAVQMALERNPSLQVQRLQPLIDGTRIDAARAAFDPTVSGSVSRSRREAPQSVLQGDTSGGISDEQAERTSTDGSLGADLLLPTGTRLSVGGTAAVQDRPSDFSASRLGASVTQPLLQGARPAANLAVLREARLDQSISVFELRGYTLAIAAEVERACWALVQSEHQLAAFRDALQVSEKQAEETQERIRVGKLPELESVAAQAEVASRRENLINAESELATRRLHLVRLLNPAQSNAWSTALAVSDLPVPPDSPPGDVEAFVSAALSDRPDLNQARLLLERGELEVIRTRNGLLPKLDLFAGIGRSGYAGSFGDSVGSPEGDGADSVVGLQLSYPLFNRAARAGHRKAVLSRMQATEALTNLCSLAQEDVRSAWVEAERARAQVAATAATLALQERKVEAEKIKFREGKSTALLVGQAERDLLASRLGHVRAIAAALVARTELYRQDGSLLARRGIVVEEK